MSQAQIHSLIVWVVDPLLSAGIWGLYAIGITGHKLGIEMINLELQTLALSLAIIVSIITIIKMAFAAVKEQKAKRKFKRKTRKK